MKTHFVEASQNQQSGFNWGKFMLARFDGDEWAHRSVIGEGLGLLRSQGWSPKHLMVFDLATGEGALFSPGGSAHADLNKHKVWVCVLFEPFLAFMYQWVREGKDPFELPAVVELPDAPAAMQGYRRTGSE